MDVVLDGEFSGTQTALMIQQHSFRVPVIFLTAFSNPATMAEIEMAGGVGCLVKPVQLRDVAAMVWLAITRNEAEKSSN
jgi:AmiR/NasT family two-component response regulator